MDFSIIIPTYNRSSDLFVCLISLTKLNYERENFEVIVVNDGNDRVDRTVFCFKHQLNIDLIECKQLGPAKARNKGALIAKGEYLMFVDDDCTLSTNCLQIIKLRFKETSAAILTGKTINMFVDNIYSETSQDIINFLYSYYNEYKENAKFFTSNNFTITTKCFKEIGGFNEKFYFAGGEDTELSNRCYIKKYKMIYTSEIVIFHWHKLTFKSFLKQQFNYGRGAYLFTEKPKKPVSFYIKLLIYPIFDRQGIEKILIATLFLISQIAVTTGLLWECWHQKYHEE